MNYSAPQQPKARSLKLIIFTSLSMMPCTIAILAYCFNIFFFTGHDFYKNSIFNFFVFLFAFGIILSLIDNYILVFCRGVVKSKKIHYGIQLAGSIMNTPFLLVSLILFTFMWSPKMDHEIRLLAIVIILEQTAYISANVLAYMTIYDAIKEPSIPAIQGIAIDGIDPAPFYPYSPQPYGQPQTQPPAHMIPYGQLIPGQHTPVVAKQ